MWAAITLAYVADILRTHSRDSDIVARFGGEEFAVIFAGATAAAVQQRAEEIRGALAQERVVFAGREARLTASAGLAEVTTNDDMETWIKRADTALYAAKSSGRNCSFCCNSSGCQRIVRSAEMPSPLSDEETPGVSPRREAAAELATEAFADTTFVSLVARRIAEWRRGGTTFSVVLARLDRPADSAIKPTVLHSTRISVPPCSSPVIASEIWTCSLAGPTTAWRSCCPAPASSMPKRWPAACVTRSLAVKSQLSDDPRISMSIGIAEGIEGNDAHRVLHRAWLALARPKAPARRPSLSMTGPSRSPSRHSPQLGKQTNHAACAVSLTCAAGRRWQRALGPLPTSSRRIATLNGNVHSDGWPSGLRHRS